MVAPADPVRDVAALFHADASLESVAVVDDGVPVGLIVGHKLTASLSQQYGFSLYAHKPILKLTDTECLIVREDDDLDAVIEAVLLRSGGKVFDDVIVVDRRGTFAGLLSVRSLMIEQNAAFGTAVAQRKLANERAVELERINRMKSQFIAHVSHELRAPVNVIIGIVELLQRELDTAVSERSRGLLRMAAASATGLRRLIGNILDMSKLEAGKLDAQPRRFDPMSMAAAVVQETEILLGPKREHVGVRLDRRGEAREMFSDDVKLRQILTNLTANAAKFTERGEIAIVVDFTATRAAFHVSDTGIGIATEQLDRMFEPFVQADDPKSRRFEGTGLGLSIAKLLAELLGGDIRVASDLGRGTTFTVDIPIELTQGDAAYEPSAQTHSAD